MALNEPYKMEILEGIKEEPITIYHIGNLLSLISFHLFNSCMLKFKS